MSIFGNYMRKNNNFRTSNNLAFDLIFVSTFESLAYSTNSGSKERAATQLICLAVFLYDIITTCVLC
jgi:hypothetical protein